MDQLHRAEQCGVGPGHTVGSITERRILACIRRWDAPLTLRSPIGFDINWDKVRSKYISEPDIGLCTMNSAQTLRYDTIDYSVLVPQGGSTLAGESMHKFLSSGNEGRQTLKRSLTATIAVQLLMIIL